jgi:hypothetical protein
MQLHARALRHAAKRSYFCMKRDCHHFTEEGSVARHWIGWRRWRANQAAADFLAKHADVVARAVGVREGDHAAADRERAARSG